MPYPVLSAEPLTWRDSDGWPKLVIMALNRPGYVEIWGENDYDSSKRWGYAPLSRGSDEGFEKDIISACYQDVGVKLYTMASRRTKSFIKMELGNLLLPEKTRRKIAQAQPIFGDQLYIIVEAKDWKLDEVRLPKPDPLIVGYRKGALYLIDAFDLTSLEKIVAVEFTTPV